MRWCNILAGLINTIRCLGRQYISNQSRFGLIVINRPFRSLAYCPLMLLSQSPLFWFPVPTSPSPLSLSTFFTAVSICVSVGFHDQTVYSAVFVVDTWMSLFRKNLENIMNGETSFQSGVPPPPEGPFSPTFSNQSTNDIETSPAYNPRARRPYAIHT